MKLKNLLKEAKLNEGLKDDLREFKTKLTAKLNDAIEYPTTVYLDEGYKDGEYESFNVTSASSLANKVIKIILNSWEIDEYIEYANKWHGNGSQDDTSLDLCIDNMVGETTGSRMAIFIDEETSILLGDEE